MKIFNSFYKYLLFFLTTLLFSWSCSVPGHTSPAATVPISDSGWKSALDRELPILGHRNWILVVDKAFPEENAPGIQTIYTDEDLLAVLKYTLDQINTSTHVRPVIYTDKELQYVPLKFAPGILIFRDSLEKLLSSTPSIPMLHDSVFTRIAEVNKLFKILILKTNDTIAYSSVYLQLDCAYWGDDAEKFLRDTMRSAAVSAKK